LDISCATALRHTQWADEIHSANLNVHLFKELVYCMGLRPLVRIRQTRRSLRDTHAVKKKN
jgi:hypothetical protein